MAKKSIQGKIQCPRCKETTANGYPAIVCPVWPDHNWTYSADKIYGGGNKTSKMHPEDDWRVVDTRRMPPDVFRPDRYFNSKEYLNARDPWRMTTPVTHKIPGWIKKYG